MKYSQISLEMAANLEHTDVHSCLRLPLPMHITFCLFVLSFSCLQAPLSPKVFKCIWSFLQISLVFISQNKREPAEISGKRLNNNYVKIACVISDQVVEVGMARVPGRMVLTSTCDSVDLTALERSQGAHGGVCFICQCFKRAWKPPLAEPVGEACYIRHFCLSKLVIREERAEELAGSEPGRRRKCVQQPAQIYKNTSNVSSRVGGKQACASKGLPKEAEL